MNVRCYSCFPFKTRDDITWYKTKHDSKYVRIYAKGLIRMFITNASLLQQDFELFLPYKLASSSWEAGLKGWSSIKRNTFYLPSIKGAWERRRQINQTHLFCEPHVLDNHSALTHNQLEVRLRNNKNKPYHAGGMDQVQQLNLSKPNLTYFGKI